MIPLNILLILLGVFNTINSKFTMFRFETVGNHVSDLGEGPHWDEKKQVLYYVDAFVGDVCKLDPKHGTTECIHLKDLVTIVIPFENSDDLLVSLRNKVVKLNWNTKKYDVIAEVASERKGKERFNDGKIDAKGRLWIGTVLEGDNGIVAHGGSLYRLDGNHFTKQSEGFSISNGMVWSNDNKKMYFNDSEDRKIYVFDFDVEKGTISNRKVFIDCDHSSDFKKGEYPDGMTIDRNGKLWVSLYAGASIVQINTETARVENRVKIPALKTTSVFFGGIHYDQLFVTTGAGDMSAEDKRKYPSAGQIFRVTSDHKDLHGFGPGHRFKP